MSEHQIEEPGSLPTDTVTVRTLASTDLDAIVRIDENTVGRSRRGFLEDKVNATLRDSKLNCSLVAELDGLLVGFMMASFHYGEFGQPEPTAVVEVLNVHPDFRRRHVGSALMRQLLMNARALGVQELRTEIAWNDHEMCHFFDRHGFKPSQRMVLGLTL